MFPTDIQLHVIHVDIVADKYSVGSELAPKVVLHSSPEFLIKGLEAWSWPPLVLLLVPFCSLLTY